MGRIFPFVSALLLILSLEPVSASELLRDNQMTQREIGLALYNMGCEEVGLRGDCSLSKYDMNVFSVRRAVVDVQSDLEAFLSRQDMGDDLNSRSYKWLVMKKNEEIVDWLGNSNPDGEYVRNARFFRYLDMAQKKSYIRAMVAARPDPSTCQGSTCWILNVHVYMRDGMLISFIFDLRE